ncbi:unnamed protein product [Eruca vesicaria subsp. sativa]|uniref:Mitochondrial transcription termination factor family protein n=1 Tax=Eruca vesicaria subsp. sativa TaxID=29727 RepID=A0ABC8K3Q4_ERUVS|nr:unnamed protein product [Eruca vesicaria subsp. sativa]
MVGMIDIVFILATMNRYTESKERILPGYVPKLSCTKYKPDVNRIKNQLNVFAGFSPKVAADSFSSAPFSLSHISFLMLSLILHGRKSLSLQRCRNLRVALNPLQDFSTASAAADTDTDTDTTLQDGRKGTNFTASYLVTSLGFTTKLAESISKKVSFEKKCNLESVLSLLRSFKFTDSQISNIIRTYPQVLTADSLGPKLKFLKSKGASTSELTEIVSKVPKILRIKNDKTLVRYYDFVKEILQADKSSNFEVSLLPNGPNKIRNVLALRQLGMPQELLFPLLISEHGAVHGKERFQESLKKVLEMGFDPTTAKFVQALRMVYQMSEKTIEERVNVYKRLGLSAQDVSEMFKKWPTFMTNSEKKITQTFETFRKCGLVEEEILVAFKKFPQCIGASEHNCVETFLGLGFSKDEVAVIFKRLPHCIGYSAETVKKKTEFLVKEMKWPLKGVVSYPAVLGMSMEKRIVPRCNVIKTLMCKGLLGSEPPPIGSALACTDELFLKRYVRKHDDDKELVDELMAILRGCRAS